MSHDKHETHDAHATMDPKTSMGVMMTILLSGVLIALVAYWINSARRPAAVQQPSTAMNEASAIDRVQTEHSELNDYPSDRLPPKSIVTLQEGNVWYVAFVQNGSGVPIISARCFRVASNGEVTETGSYTPMGADAPLTISAKTCR